MKSRFQICCRVRVVQHSFVPSLNQRIAFTLVELLVVVATLTLLASILTTGLARTSLSSKAGQCANNLRQLTAGTCGWSIENNDVQLSCADPTFISDGVVRLNWVQGRLDYNGANRSNWDTNQDLVLSPVWKSVGRSPSVFRCPADTSIVRVQTANWPRVRSYSLSGVFGRGEWLDKTYNPSQTVWRTYTRSAQIVAPARTIMFMDMHPDAINDAEFKTACTGAQPGDPPSLAQIIDLPAGHHNNAANMSFADGHVLAHRWMGTAIRPRPLFTSIGLNFPAGDSWADVQWLAANTSVRR